MIAVFFFFLLDVQKNKYALQLKWALCRELSFFKKNKERAWVGAAGPSNQLPITNSIPLCMDIKNTAGTKKKNTLALSYYATIMQFCIC